jgi:hypothetical protein
VATRARHTVGGEIGIVEELFSELGVPGHGLVSRRAGDLSTRIVGREGGGGGKEKGNKQSGVDFSHGDSLFWVIPQLRGGESLIRFAEIKIFFSLVASGGDFLHGVVKNIYVFANPIHETPPLSYRGRKQRLIPNPY